MLPISKVLLQYFVYMLYKNGKEYVLRPTESNILNVIRAAQDMLIVLDCYITNNIIIFAIT